MRSIYSILRVIPLLRLLHQGRNQGAGPFPIFRMLYLSRDLFAFIDGFDVWMENKLEFPT